MAHFRGPLTLIAFVLATISITSGCATRDVTIAEKNEDFSPKEGYKGLDSFRLSDAKKGSAVPAPELDMIPEEINPAVEKWMTYFQGRGRPHMERYLARSARYEALMKTVLRENGLPEDLFYIAMIESGFTAHAFSSASAVGYWQFIRGTGKRYGLQMNQLVDERRDPVLATQAAADYFKGLYSIFGSWYLAMASYNVGENRVKRETMKHNTQDFWELARKRRLPRETMDYVPKYIAARMIAKNPDKYGFGGIDYLPAIEFENITLDKPVNLRLMAEKMSYNYEDIKALNPKFKGEVAPLKGETLILRVPPSLVSESLLAAQEAVVEKVEYVADAGDLQTYRIRSGDNLSTIAQRYRTTVAYLRDVNDIPRSRVLRIGMRLLVPDRTPLKSRKDRGQYYAKIEKDNEAKKTASGSRYHLVQSGDSLSTIAKKYNTSVSTLKRMNNLRSGRIIRAGTRLAVPGGAPVDEGRQPAGQNSSRLKKSKSVHVVRKGDTLGDIADRYRISMRELQDHNRIRNPSAIAVGTRLQIPH